MGKLEAKPLSPARHKDVNGATRGISGAFGARTWLTIRQTIGALVVTVLLVGTGTAIAQNDWIHEEPTSPNATGVTYLEDPVAGPTEVTDGPLSQLLLRQLQKVPELVELGPPRSTDFLERGVQAAVVTFEAPDGAFVDIVSQQLLEPLSVEAIGPPDTTHLESGPNGEEIVVKETPYVLQVIGVRPDGWMVNIIVNRTSAGNPSEQSRHTQWTADAVRTWVIGLLELADDQ